MSLVDYIDSGDDQNSIEVVSNYDEKDNDLIDMTKNLMFTSDGDSDSNSDSGFDGKPINGIGGEDANIRSTRTIIDIHHVVPIDNEIHSSSKSDHSNISNIRKNTKDLKRKRRCWSVEKKLEILHELKSNRNKRGTASANDCSPAQLRKWLLNENKLVAILKSKN
ncbi:unnamed protein product, partial [Adineta ricciae]